MERNFPWRGHNVCAEVPTIAVIDRNDTPLCIIRQVFADPRCVKKWKYCRSYQTDHVIERARRVFGAQPRVSQSSVNGDNRGLQIGHTIAHARLQQAFHYAVIHLYTAQKHRDLFWRTLPQGGLIYQTLPPQTRLLSIALSASLVLHCLNIDVAITVLLFRDAWVTMLVNIIRYYWTD